MIFVWSFWWIVIAILVLGIIGTAVAFIMMDKKDAVLINVGRGSAIATSDLIEVLNQGHLYGVGLDVLEEEPLPPAHPLWKQERVLLTPHVSGGYVWESARHYYTELVIRNLHHLKAHEELENLVDFETGYRYHTTL